MAMRRLARGGGHRATSLEFNPAAANVAQIFIEPDMIADDEVTGTYESIVLRTQEPSAVEEAGNAAQRR